MRLFREWGGPIAALAWFVMWLVALQEFSEHQGGDKQADLGRRLRAGGGSLYVREDGEWVRRAYGEFRW